MGRREGSRPAMGGWGLRCLGLGHAWQTPCFPAEEMEDRSATSNVPNRSLGPSLWGNLKIRLGRGGGGQAERPRTREERAASWSGGADKRVTCASCL